MSNIVGYTKEFFYNCTVALIVKPYQTGWRGFYKIYSVQGFEKLSKSIQATCEYAPRLFVSLGTSLAPLAKVASDHREILYATMSLDAIGNFVKLESGRVKLVIPDASKFLNGIGSFIDTGKFVKKYFGIQFTIFSNLATQLEGFSIGNVKPFTYRPFQALCYNPKDFFIFTASVIDILNSLKRFFFATGTEEQIKRARCYKELHTTNLLQQAGNIGKMSLIWFSSTSYDTTEFKLLNFVTQNLSLLNFFIKAR